MRAHVAFWDRVLPGLLLLLLAGPAQTAAAALPAQQQPLSVDADGSGSGGGGGGVPAHGSRGAVASESAICTEIGLDLMRRGGNAADALVGTTLCVGVVGMYHSGIGGGGFMLVRRPHGGGYETVDYRETAPAAAFEDMYDGNVRGSVLGGLAVAVPGELRGLDYLHRTYGALPWRTVVEPAVRVARDGFPVSEDLVRYMAAATADGDTFLTDDPVWAEDFAPNGTLLGLGDTLTRKRYARTLETIAEDGIESFYSGAMARAMVDVVRAHNGTLTLDDLRAYRVQVRPAVNTTFRGRRLFSTGAPSSGAVALSVLKTMEQFGVGDDGGGADANLTTHRFDEALRFAYGARTRLGDPAYVPGVAALEADLVSAARAAANRAAIRDDRTLPVEAYDPDGTLASPGHGTSHVVAADASGLAISSTTTINTLFGARLMTPGGGAGGGIVLNNEMNDFGIPHADNEFGYPPSAANLIRGGKRPLSSITPVMAEDAATGRLELVTGAAGGSRIISATAQVAWHVLAGGRGMAAALAAPRLHDQLVPNQVTFELAFDNATVAAMAARGHRVAWTAAFFSAAQGIRVRPDGVFDAAGEPRQRSSGGGAL